MMLSTKATKGWVLSLADLDELILNILNTTFGDANLDERFNPTDLIRVFQAGEYQDNLEDNSTWSSGDWNCDREFDSSDLIRAFQSGQYAATARSVDNQIAAAIDLIMDDASSKQRQAFARSKRN